VRAEALPVDDLTKRADALFAGEDREPAHLAYAVQMLQAAGRKAERPGLAVPYLERAMAATAGSDDEGVAALHAGLAVDHALHVEKDAGKAVELKRATLPEGWKDDPRQLNRFAWWCYENLVNLEEAEALARRGADLAPAGPDRASLLDTAAEICNARGNHDDAVELIRRAVADDPDKEFYKEQLARFEKIRAESAR